MLFFTFLGKHQFLIPQILSSFSIFCLWQGKHGFQYAF
jgi:hypothetical protein